MNKTVRAWQVALSLGRARRIISFYFPCSRPSRVPANHWKSERALVFMDGTALIVYTGRRNSRLKGGGVENTSGIKTPRISKAPCHRCLENAVRGKRSEMRGEVKQKGELNPAGGRYARAHWIRDRTGFPGKRDCARVYRDCRFVLTLSCTLLHFYFMNHAKNNLA